MSEKIEIFLKNALTYDLLCVNICMKRRNSKHTKEGYIMINTKNIDTFIKMRNDLLMLKSIADYRKQFLNLSEKSLDDIGLEETKDILKDVLKLLETIPF